MDWIEFKLYLSQVTHLSKDALHVYSSVLIQLGSAFVLRRSLRSPLPWLCVLAAILLNEGYDLLEPHKAIEEWQIIGGSKDFLNTMLMPSLLMLAAWAIPTVMGREKDRSGRDGPITLSVQPPVQSKPS